MERGQKSIRGRKEQMDKKEILDILDNAKDDRGAVPMRLVRQALDKLSAIQPISSAQPEPDCISRQAAIEALGEKPLVWDDLSDFDLGKAAQWSDDVDAIKALPSAQPKRKTGKWIRTDMTDIVDGKYINWAKWNCSECGVVKKIGWAKGVNFCPNCGADMRGEDDV